MATSRSFGVDTEIQIRKFSEAGFEGFFTSWDEDLKKCRALADRLGIEYQSVHAPTNRMSKIWDEGEEGEMFAETLICCVRDCAESGVPIIVAHTYGGKGGTSEGPTELGLERLCRVVNEAERHGVKIAFENTWRLNYLDAVINAFRDNDNVGFCWDTGHQLCYKPEADVMERYGDKLICTHLNDNLGISDPGGRVTSQDDLHLLPFDGIGDWEYIVDKLNKFGYSDFLTLELSIENSQNRFDSEKYRNISIDQYIAEAYARACRVAALKNKKK